MTGFGFAFHDVINKKAADLITGGIGKLEKLDHALISLERAEIDGKTAADDAVRVEQDRSSFSC